MADAQLNPAAAETRRRNGIFRSNRETLEDYKMLDEGSYTLPSLPLLLYLPSAELLPAPTQTPRS